MFLCNKINSMSSRVLRARGCDHAALRRGERKGYRPPLVGTVHPAGLRPARRFAYKRQPLALSSRLRRSGRRKGEAELAHAPQTPPPPCTPSTTWLAPLGKTAARRSRSITARFTRCGSFAVLAHTTEAIFGGTHFLASLHENECILGAQRSVCALPLAVESRTVAPEKKPFSHAAFFQAA